MSKDATHVHSVTFPVPLLCRLGRKPTAGLSRDQPTMKEVRVGNQEIRQVCQAARLVPRSLVREEPVPLNEDQARGGRNRDRIVDDVVDVAVIARPQNGRARAELSALLGKEGVVEGLQRTLDLAHGHLSPLYANDALCNHIGVVVKAVERQRHQRFA